MKQNLVILGSTGSIGKSTLKVVSDNLDKFCIYGLVANSSINVLIEQIKKYNPKFVALSNEVSAKELYLKLKELNLSVDVLSGDDGICQLVKHQDVDLVMSAIVGFSGLRSTLSALIAGKKVLLANKESLVTAAHLCFDAVKKYNSKIIPVDSEHNAMFQSLPLNIQNNLGFCDLNSQGITSLILTASGGPFRDRDLNSFDNITVDEALAHPNWSMGKKISIDSATMMNKGLELIETARLFNCDSDFIEVLIHPESIIHSAVRYKDGSVISQCGKTDMSIPIAYALAYPDRIEHYNQHIDFLSLSPLTFRELDINRYPCFDLARQALSSGILYVNKLNSANEIAVDAFLNRRIRFNQIYSLISWVLEQELDISINSLDEIIDCDKKIRIIANRWINIYGC